MVIIVFIVYMKRKSKVKISQCLINDHARREMGSAGTASSIHWVFIAQVFETMLMASFSVVAER